MNRKNLTLISRIEAELSDIGLLKDKILRAWEKIAISSDSFYLDSVALNLHGFYSALERIFVLIAKEIDGSLPSGSSWHYELLLQMKTDIKRLRPAVISDDTCQKLDEYRGFRHIVRNVYSFNFSIIRIEPLVERLPGLFEQTKAEINTFLKLMDE